MLPRASPLVAQEANVRQILCFKNQGGVAGASLGEATCDLQTAALNNTPVNCASLARPPRAQGGAPREWCVGGGVGAVCAAVGWVRGAVGAQGELHCAPEGYVVTVYVRLCLAHSAPARAVGGAAHHPAPHRRAPQVRQGLLQEARRVGVPEDGWFESARRRP
jgi:hypothetical protein